MKTNQITPKQRRYWELLQFDNNDQFLYVIGSAGSELHKIGISNHPLKRLDLFQTGNPSNLRIKFCIIPPDNARKIERKVHKQLTKEWRLVKGEWFRAPISIILETVLKACGNEESLIFPCDKKPYVEDTIRGQSPIGLLVKWGDEL